MTRPPPRRTSPNLKARIPGAWIPDTWIPEARTAPTGAISGNRSSGNRSSQNHIHPLPPANPTRSRHGTPVRTGTIRATRTSTPTGAVQAASASQAPSHLDVLHDRLLAAALRRNATPSLVPGIRRAAQEAAAIAWLQPFPLLAFPGLFEEALHAARRRHHRQNLIRSRSEEWLGLAS
jgi:hypothetical protein